MNFINTFQDYLQLCKPKVVFLMLITTWVGMILATQNIMPPVSTVFIATLGIACAASSAAVINHLVDRHIDAKMTRTSQRPIAKGRIKPMNAFTFAMFLGTLGIFLLFKYTNNTTTILTLATLFGYAVFYTMFLKRATPQNIVIGGIAGATPPLLGWSAISNSIDPFSLILVLIIFIWTPPHFWALAIYRYKDYLAANIPMLPITHGIKFTKLSILLYTILLLTISIFPYLIGMSGLLYLLIAIIFGLGYMYYSYKLYKTTTKEHFWAIRGFQYSIFYLAGIFISLIIDHYLQIIIVKRLL